MQGGTAADDAIRSAEQQRRDFKAAISTGSTATPLPPGETEPTRRVIELEPGHYSVEGRSIRVTTTVGQAVLNNLDQIEFVGRLFVLLLEEKIRQINDEDSIAELEDLKQRIEKFLGAASQLVTAEAPEKIEAKLLEARRNVWAKRYVTMVDVGLAAMLATVFHLTDPVSTIAAAIIVGGRPAAEVLKAYFEKSTDDDQ